MTINDLPAKLRVEGVKIVDPDNKEKITVHLSEKTMLALEEIYLRHSDKRKEKGA